ncbi:MAG TPA: M48 family peptidase [Firmicutes bacterium]|nr:M48 family peptidase [Bacillota bacterium]
MAKLCIDDLEIEVIRKKIKNIYLSVRPPDGHVRMSVPAKMDQETISFFARSKLPWIKKQRAKILDRPAQLVPEYVSGEHHFLFGVSYELKVTEQTGRTQVELDKNQYINLTVPPGSTQERRQKVMMDWYRRQLKAVIPQYLEKWEREIGVAVRECRVRRMKTKWGTCNIRDRRIWLNLELVKKSPACLEYIIVHELIHLLERYHNDRFYAYLTKYLPTWKQLKKELN